MSDDQALTDDAAAKATAEAEKATAADVEKWKALSRKNEDRAKENSEKAKKVDELQAKLDAFESSKLSESEKAEKRIADIEKKLADAQGAQKTAEVAALRTRIGTAKGLPALLVARLKGDDAASIEADADEMVAGLPKDAMRVWPELGQGEQGSTTVSGNAAMNQKIRSAAGRA